VRLAIVLRHGRSSTSFRALGTDLQVWFPSPPLPPSADSTAGPDAMVAYAAVRGAAVAAGEPLASASQLIPVAEAFVAAQRAAGRRPSFFATEGRLAQSPQLARRLIGEQPVWDPRAWHDTVRAHRSLREQLRRARAKQVVVEPVDSAQLTSAPFADALAVLQARWRATRSMPPMGFLVTQGLSEGVAARRTWLARQGDTLVGVLSLAPLPARPGWLLEHLLRDPDAPNGTAELLVDVAMRALAADGVSWATLGLAPLHGDIDATLARVRAWSRPLFNFAGLSQFKQKLRPHQWEPIYLAWPATGAGWRAMLDGLRAFAGGSFVRFGIHTIWRGPTPALRALEWLLVAWTVLLAMAPTTPWFPSRTVQGAWVVFDALLLLALRTVRTRSRAHGAAARRIVARLATGVAVAVTLDALLTLSEAWSVRTPLRAGAWGMTLTGIACAGPLLAAPMLWGAALRARLLARPMAQLHR
jgi:phosphatidylglycerol lysyltransferase